MTLSELIRAASAGDQDAWSEIVGRFSGLVWATARAHRLTQAQAADVTQTTWLRLVENLDRIEDPERLGAWLATPARRGSLAVIRRPGQELVTGDDWVLDAPIDEPLDGPLLVRERDDALRRAL